MKQVLTDITITHGLASLTPWILPGLCLLQEVLWSLLPCRDPQRHDPFQPSYERTAREKDEIPIKMFQLTQTILGPCRTGFWFGYVGLEWDRRHNPNGITRYSYSDHIWGDGRCGKAVFSSIIAPFPRFDYFCDWPFSDLAVDHWVPPDRLQPAHHKSQLIYDWTSPAAGKRLGKPFIV